MAIKFSVIKEPDPQGKLGLLGTRGEHASAVWFTCPCGASEHNKACAQALLDYHPVLTPFKQGEDGEPDVAEVLGKSPRESLVAWFAALDGRPPAPAPVALPTKMIQVKDDKGVMVDKVVDNPDLE
jgi:hypothetical protein